MAITTVQRQIPESVAFIFGLTFTLVGIVGFTVLQYLLPASFHSIMGGDYNGFLFYAHHLGITPKACSVQTFIGSFRVILISLVVVHLAACRAALYIDPKYFKPFFFLVVAMNLFVAVLYPPTQSVDTFNYAALARISSSYGLNPYTHSSVVLVQQHDSVAPFLKLAFKSMYGPLWTILSTGMSFTLSKVSLFLQILSYKILEGGCLVLASHCAALYCKKRNETYALPAMLAIGLNPLSLLEGPGNGHNDILMVCLCICALYLYDKGSQPVAFLLVGLSAAIKFVPFFVLPWIGMEYLRQRPKIHLVSAVKCLSLIFLPIVVLMAPYWDHGAALAGLMSRMQNARESLIVKVHQDNILPATSHPVEQILHVLNTQQELIALYLLLTILLLARNRIRYIPIVQRMTDACVEPGNYPAWIFAWVAFATLQRYAIHTLWYSWYYTWAIFPAACLWTKKGNPLLIATMAMALVDTLFYTF